MKAKVSGQVVQMNVDTNEVLCSLSNLLRLDLRQILTTTWRYEHVCTSVCLLFLSQQYISMSIEFSFGLAMTRLFNSTSVTVVMHSCELS